MIRNLVKSDSAQSNDDDASNPVASRIKGLELDLRMREFEISQLTQRNNFFMIFQGVLIAGLVQSHGNAAPIISFCMSFLGFGISILQIGMAGGAKYWQVRWEASTRSSEIAIVLDLVARNKLAVQTFTLSHSLLSEDEKKAIDEWNLKQLFESHKIQSDNEYIKNIVSKDVSEGSKGLRGLLDFWVRKWAILPKWSVSRIPIWAGAILSVFWIIILFNTVELSFSKNPVKLVPIKEQANDSPTINFDINIKSDKVGSDKLKDFSKEKFIGA